MKTLTTSDQSCGMTLLARQLTAMPMASVCSKLAVTSLILASIGGAGWKLMQYSEIDKSLLSMGFLSATALAVLYRMMNPLGWVAVLRGFGHRVHAGTAVRIWLMAESRRWLPGGIWGYTSRAVRAKEMGVPAATASASMLVELLVTLLAAVLVSVVGLVLHYDLVGAIVAGFARDYCNWQVLVLVAGASLVMLDVCYLLRAKLFAKLQSLNAKWSLLDPSKLEVKQLAVAIGYFVAMACLNGAVNLLILKTCSNAHVPVTAMIAATAAAWIVGYLAFFSPGGLFVREGALAVLLMPWVPYQVAFTLAILSRVAQLLAEVICMAWPMLAKRPAS